MHFKYNYKFQNKHNLNNNKTIKSIKTNKFVKNKSDKKNNFKLNVIYLKSVFHLNRLLLTLQPTTHKITFPNQTGKEKTNDGKFCFDPCLITLYTICICLVGLVSVWYGIAKG